MFASKVIGVRDNINKRVIFYIDDTQEFLTLEVTQPCDLVFYQVDPRCGLGVHLKNKRPLSYFLNQNRSDNIERFAKVLFDQVNKNGFVPEFSRDVNIMENIGDIFLYDYYKRN